MSLISLINLNLNIGTHHLLFENANFTVEENERICIVGRNGVGKSALLKVIDNELSFDSGKLIKQQGLRIARLAQMVPSTLEGTVFQIVAEGAGEVGQLLIRYQQLASLTSHSNLPNLLQEMEAIAQKLDFHQGWAFNHKIENIISRLSLKPDDQFSALSGGLKRRVLLGQLLAKEPHILLLDEPTNHLDIESIIWLEDFLLEFQGTTIFITHDRSFLQKLATRIVEIDRGEIKSFACNFQQYLQRKQQALETEATHNKLFDKKLAQEEIWLRQGIKARRTRNEGRVRSLVQLREQRRQRREKIGTAQLHQQKLDLSGKLVIEAKNISYSYDSQAIIKNFSMEIIRGDKIGILGPNGIGKTTLLKILLGELHPTQGTIRHGTKLEIAYFDQLRAQLDPEKSVAESVSYGDNYVKINDKSIHVMSYLQDFLFTPERARIAVKMLSGGEQNRLLLARLFTKPANVLVLDEPTNDLDIETLELLEEWLLNYQGTLLIVSHDRSFLNNVVTSTLVFEGAGTVQEYIGGYDDWLIQKSKNTLPKVQANKNASVTSITKPSSTKEIQVRKKEINNLEAKIDKLENEKKVLFQQLSDPLLYNQSDKQLHLTSLQQKLKNLDEELTQLIERWENLIS